MKKIFLSVFVFMMALTTMTPLALSAEEVSETENLKEGRLAPVMTCGKHWETYGNKTYKGIAYGSWRYGPAISNKGHLTLESSLGATESITGTYSGEKKVSNASFTSGLSYMIGRSYSKKVTYDIYGETGKTKQIKYRPMYSKYEVKQRQYERCTGGGSTTKKYTGQYKTAYALKPNDWSYSWRYI